MSLHQAAFSDDLLVTSAVTRMQLLKSRASSLRRVRGLRWVTYNTVVGGRAE